MRAQHTSAASLHTPHLIHVHAHSYVFLICVIACVSHPQATITIDNTTAPADAEESVDAATPRRCRRRSCPERVTQPMGHGHHAPTGETHPALRALQATDGRVIWLLRPHRHHFFLSGEAAHFVSRSGCAGLTAARSARA